MAINLQDKYAKDIQEQFTRESLLTGRLSDKYNFSGVKTVNVVTPITVPMVDYTRSGVNRYGTPTEMQDIVQELTLTQDKSFTMTIDKGNNEDQSGVKEAGKMLALQISEQAIPLMDTYCFNKLAHEAGKIVSESTALTKSNICTRISAGTLFMDNAEVPVEDRTLYINADGYNLLRFSDEFSKCDSVLKTAITKGQVGTYDGMPVVKVPASRWPENVNFIIVHKSAACAPVKLNDTKLHRDPPGISGNLLEGRQYYDLFVFGAKANGVYVDVNSKAVICATPKISATGALSCDTAAAVIKYTTDGSDPRYSRSAKVGVQVEEALEGITVRACATVDGGFTSDVAELTA